MKPDPQKASIKPDIHAGRYVGEEDLSDDDDFEPVLESGSRTQDGTAYREYTLRVLPWVDWDKLFTDTQSEPSDSLELSDSSQSGDEDELGNDSGESAARNTKEAAEAEFVRREYILARFPNTDGCTTDKREQTTGLRFDPSTKLPVPKRGAVPRYQPGGFARLCREGEETLRERLEALEETQRVDAQLKVGKAPWYKQRRDLEGIARIPERYRKRLILEVEETSEPAQGASASEPSAAHMSDAKNAGRPEATRTVRDDPKAPSTKRRKVFYGTMDSALGSDYCLMIVRDDRTIDLVPVGRYAWHNFKFAPKLSDMANERMHRRDARQAVDATRPSEMTVDRRGSSPVIAGTGEQAITVSTEDDPLVHVEQKLRARAALADTILERRRHLVDSSSHAASLWSGTQWQRPFVRRTDEGVHPPHDSEPAVSQGQLDPSLLLSRREIDSSDESNAEDRSGEDDVDVVRENGRHTPERYPNASADDASVLAAAFRYRGGQTPSCSHSNASGSGTESQSSLERLERYQAEDPLRQGSFSDAGDDTDMQWRHRSGLSENGRMLKRLLEREKTAQPPAGVGFRSEIPLTRPSSQAPSDAGATGTSGYDSAPRFQEHESIAGSAGAKYPGKPVSAGEQHAVPSHLLPAPDGVIEEMHIKAVLRYLARQGSYVTVKELLSYFQPWFPAQKERVAALVRKMCTAREIPPGSGRICVLLKEQVLQHAPAS